MIPPDKQAKLEQQRAGLAHLLGTAWEHDEEIDVSNAMYQALIAGLLYIGDSIRAAAGESQ